MKRLILTAISLTLISHLAQASEVGSVGTSTQPPQPMVNERTLPDNTEVNKRDRNENAKTPMDQSLTKSDQAITQHIRKSIMKEEDLSTNAKNVKVITQNGEVTLRGPVNSAAEVEMIVKRAKAVPGVKTLHNQMEVKSES